MKEAVLPSFGEHRILVSFLQAQPAAEALLLLFIGYAPAVLRHEFPLRNKKIPRNSPRDFLPNDAHNSQTETA